MKGRSFLIVTMNKSDTKLLKRVTIINDLGLHARSAAQIAKLARNVKSKMWIIKDGEKVDAASIIDILTLACPKGSKIILKIEDHSDLDILNDIAKLIERGFGE